MRAVFFDAAGTLFDVAEPVGETYARFARREGIDADPRAVERAFGRAFAASVPLAFPDSRPVDRQRLEREWWRRLVLDTFTRAGVEASPAALERAFGGLFAHYTTAEAWRTYPDVAPALQRLQELGARLAVVSNFDSRLRTLLDALGLSPAFHAIVLSSECGFAKPDRRIFEAALRATGSSAAATLHVGDSETLDRRAATQAGLAAVRLDRGGAASAHVITDLEKLAERLTRL